MSDTPEDGTFLESYEELSRAELVEECKARGLKENGNKQLLIQRLEADDAAEAARADKAELPFEPEDEWLGKPDDNPPGPEDLPEAPEMAAKEPESEGPPETPDEPAEAGSGQPSGHAFPTALGQQSDGIPKGHSFYAEFDLPSDYDLLEEDLDLDWKLRARDAAIAEGCEPLGGAYSAHNIGFGSRDGKRTIIYNVPIKTG